MSTHKHDTLQTDAGRVASMVLAHGTSWSRTWQALTGPASLLATSASKTASAFSGASAKNIAEFSFGQSCPLTHLVVANQTVAIDMRIGCHHGCSCPSFQRCYSRHSEGICDTELYIMVLMSAAIFLAFLCALFLLRVYLLYREFVSEQRQHEQTDVARGDKLKAEGSAKDAAASNAPREIVIFDDDGDAY